MLFSSPHRVFYLPTIAFIAIFVGPGCSDQQAQKRDPYRPGVVAIASPRELFPGDLKGLEPHLDLIASGSVGLNVRDPGWGLEVSLQVWKKGKAEKPQFVGQDYNPVDEVSISIRQLYDQKSQVKVTIAQRTSKGRIVYANTLEKANRGKGEESGKVWGGFTKGLLAETAIEKGQPTPIWGYMYGEVGGIVNLDEPFEETAKRQDWAVLLIVTPHKKE